MCKPVYLRLTCHGLSFKPLQGGRHSQLYCTVHTTLLPTAAPHTDQNKALKLFSASRNLLRSCSLPNFYEAFYDWSCSVRNFLSKERIHTRSTNTALSVLLTPIDPQHHRKDRKSPWQPSAIFRNKPKKCGPDPNVFNRRSNPVSEDPMSWPGQTWEITNTLLFLANSVLECENIDCSD